MVKALILAARFSTNVSRKQYIQSSLVAHDPIILLILTQKNKHLRTFLPHLCSNRLPRNGNWSLNSFLIRLFVIVLAVVVVI